MGKAKKFVIVSDDPGNWEGLYVDGKLVAEDHSIRLHMLADAAGIKIEHRSLVGDLEEHGHQMPEKLSDIKTTKA